MWKESHGTMGVTESIIQDPGSLVCFTVYFSENTNRKLVKWGDPREAPEEGKSCQFTKEK